MQAGKNAREESFLEITIDDLRLTRASCERANQDTGESHPHSGGATARDRGIQIRASALL